MYSTLDCVHMPMTCFVSHCKALLTAELCEQHVQAWHVEASALCAGCMQLDTCTSMLHHGLIAQLSLNFGLFMTC